MIYEELSEDLIFLNVDATTSSDVFKLMGEALTEKGYTKDSYVQALIDRERDYPTGLDIGGFGIAIPHTDISHVNKTAIAVATLKNTVDWIHLGSADDHVDVSVVFMLVVDDPNKHIDQLQRIVQIIQDKEVMQALAKSPSASEIINAIKQKEDSLDN